MLTNALVKAARPRACAYKLADERGLHLHIAPTGHRSWRLRFRWKRREQLMVLGSVPEVSLAEARSRRDWAREQLEINRDPRASIAPFQITHIRNFAIVARAWHAHMTPGWSPLHAADVLANLERDVFGTIGDLELDAIDRPMVLKLLRHIEARGTIETARRIRHRISAVFRYAISEGWCDTDPADVLTVALKRRPAQQRMSALVTIASARALISAVRTSSTPPVVRIAHEFLALTAVRLGTLRLARWSEIEALDLEHPLWRIPAAHMKLSVAQKASADNDHVIPLSRAAVGLLQELQRLKPGSDLLFPGARRGLPIGENALRDAIDAAGFSGRHVPHGWRATFSTVMNEAYPEDRTIIDAALGHSLKSGDGRAAKVESAYNRSLQLDARRRVFDAWANLLLEDDAAARP
jgi:integrase